jgi:glycoside/pentoside/hexuronide:cation symporter, GPH family
MSAEIVSSSPRLGWPTKALYGLSALGSTVKGGLSGLTLFFYAQLIGLDAPLVSLALAISLFIDAFWDPVVGQISDNTKTRLGRRHPFIYAAALPASLFFAAIYMPPLGWSDQGVFLWLLGTVILSRLFESLIEIPNAALLPELSRNYDERTSLASWRYLFLAVVGRVASVLLTFGVFLRETPHQKFGQMNQAGYAPLAITVAAIACVTILLSALSTQRFTPFMHQPVRRRPSFREMAREVGGALGNRNFAALAISGFIFGIAVGISGGLLTYFMTYYWELPSAALRALGLWAIPGGLVGVVAAPYWARWLGKKRGCLIVFFLSIASTTVPIGLRLLGWMPPNSSPWVLRILIVDSIATGLLSITGFIIVTAMLADVVEEVQVKTAQRSEGVLFAADSLLRKITTSFATIFPGLIIGYIHFPKFAQPGAVNPEILRHLAIIYLPTITFLYLCSTSCILFYRIDRQRHEENLDRIARSAELASETDPELNPHLAPDVLPNPEGAGA